LKKSPPARGGNGETQTVLSKRFPAVSKKKKKGIAGAQTDREIKPGVLSPAPWPIRLPTPAPPVFPPARKTRELRSEGHRKTPCPPPLVSTRGFGPAPCAAPPNTPFPENTRPPGPRKHLVPRGLFGWRPVRPLNTKKGAPPPPPDKCPLPKKMGGLVRRRPHKSPQFFRIGSSWGKPHPVTTAPPPCREKQAPPPFRRPPVGWTPGRGFFFFQRKRPEKEGAFFS